MKKLALLFSLVALLVLSCNIAFAGSQDFTLVNNTGYVISKVYVSPSNTDDWQEDVMGTGVLGNGESVDIAFSGGDRATYWDLKIVFSDDSSLYWKSINLKATSCITLLPNGNARYE